MRLFKKKQAKIHCFFIVMFESDIETGVVVHRAEWLDHSIELPTTELPVDSLSIT